MSTWLPRAVRYPRRLGGQAHGVQSALFGSLVDLQSLAGRGQKKPASQHARKRPEGSFLMVQVREGAPSCTQKEGGRCHGLSCQFLGWLELPPRPIYNRQPASTVASTDAAPHSTSLFDSHSAPLLSCHGESRRRQHRWWWFCGSFGGVRGLLRHRARGLLHRADLLPARNSSYICVPSVTHFLCFTDKQIFLL